jgi:hypothetical protein
MDESPFDVLEGSKNIPSAITRRRNGFSRLDVVNAFHQAFEIIGGTTRLALWANENPEKFYPLFAKLMPSTSLNIIADGNQVVIEHALPPTPLDEHPTDVIEHDNDADQV